MYTDELCFLLQKGCRQGYQWLPQSPIYKREKNQWLATDSPLDLCQFVLRRTLSEEAYSHTGVRDFLAGLEVSIEQLNLSIAKMKEGLSFIPQTAYDWYVKGEMIASLRDRPFHPTSKAKIGFTRQDYQEYMAEFGQKTSLNWVAIANHSVVKGCLMIKLRHWMYSMIFKKYRLSEN
ncbi:IucA/IucC family protein [Caldalkalibacillus mannanilyticus]|uniref:IucA/IucC family protein n=1 Tax=Caldalkalibacillus mannanilyticus TaxID=1418 RepID=UPI0022772C76|nr:IucA/IucC family protein [Caldalkalibacillus mannanilyticus]